MKRRLAKIYEELFLFFGPQHWWPAETSFEVMVGAILTQNTSWSNVEKAIDCLKKSGNLTPRKLQALSPAKLAHLIRSAGFYNLKAQRLKNFLDFFFKKYQGRVSKMALEDKDKLRLQLLAVKGIGAETADSILLYALNKPVFVVDAYTKRIFSRHGLVKVEDDYATVQEFFTRNLKPEVKIFNEYHALLVRLAKEYCLKSKPRCLTCPLHDQKRTFN